MKQAFNTTYHIRLQLSFHHMKFHPPWVISWGVWVLEKLLRTVFGAFRSWVEVAFFPFNFLSFLFDSLWKLVCHLPKVFNLPSSSGCVQTKMQDSLVLHTDKPIKTKVGCSWVAKTDQIQQTEGVKFRNCDGYWGLCLSLTENSIFEREFSAIFMKISLSS